MKLPMPDDPIDRAVLKGLAALIVVVIVMSCCASCGTLSQPVSTQPVDPTTGAPVGPAVPATNEDGTPMTVGDAVADTVDGLTPLVTGTATALGGPMGGILAAGLLAFGAGALRKKKSAPKVESPPPAA